MTAEEKVNQWRKLKALNERVKLTIAEMEVISNQLGVDGVQFFLLQLVNAANRVDSAIEAVTTNGLPPVKETPNA